MNIVEELRQDCSELHEEYSKLISRDVLAKTKEEARIKEKNLYESGKLIVDFYNKSFVPKYSESSEEVVQSADGFFYDLANMVTRAMNNKNYFGLSVLLLPRGSKEGYPDRLEVLIDKLDEAIEVKEK